MLASANKLKTLLVLILAYLVYYFAPIEILEPARRILFIFVIAACFWAFEIIPLYATSLLVVILEIFLLARPNGVLAMDANGYQMFLLPFGSPIIILFMGGFILARAFHKYGIDKIIATRLLKVFGQRPYNVLLGFMITTASLSMWMSDTATAAMMIAMVLPVLNQLGEGNKFRTGLILSIAFSALIGGMGTPVGTPPNAIAMGLLAEAGIEVNFLSWMKIAIPIASVLLVVISIVLYALYPSSQKKISLKIGPVEPIDRKALITIIIGVVAIGLWLTTGFHKIPSAVIALLAACLFAVTGLLNQSDFKSINWDILILMWGGLSLGKGMEVSGLISWIVQQPIFQQEGFVLISAFSILAVILSTLMSNTATANLIIPIVMAIPGENHLILVSVIALSCSLSMALPVSTPPNAIAMSTNMLKSLDMFKAGVICSMIAVAIILLSFKFFIL